MTKTELKALKRLRETLTMKNAGFRDRLVDNDFWKVNAERQTVAEVTRLWRESYVFPILDKLIEKYDK